MQPESEHRCCACGSLLWMALGTEPPRAWCLDHWRQSWVTVQGRPEDESGAPGQTDLLLQDAATTRQAAAEQALRAEVIAL